ncbi:MAG: SDR family NAD(P)-dependent oxidoreductase [Chthoniobacterales bacterium]
MSEFDLSGQVALVTGSTRGIGAGIAASFAAAGAKVLRNGTRPTGEKDVLVYDLLKPEAPEQMIEEAFSREPDLSMLVCNAGSFFDTSFLEMDQERFTKTIQLNVQHVYFLIQGFAKRLIAKKRPGSVVIVSSTNGFWAEENSTAYDMSKGALVMLTRSLALNLAAHNIRVNGMAPGLIRTPLTSDWMDTHPEKVRHYEKKILLGKVGKPEDCGGACVFLCSPAARYIVGQIIVVDGGLTVGQIGKM